MIQQVKDTITVTITNGSSVFSVYNLESVDALSTKELLLQPLIVEETEIVKVTAATANRLHVILSVLEMTRTT